MNTYTQATQYGRLREAYGAAQLLESRFGDLSHNSPDMVAAPDAYALIEMLRAAHADFSAGSHDGSQQAYTLTWSTTGDNDATTKAQLIEWLHAGRRAPAYGACHGITGSLVPTLGADLLALFEQLPG